MIHLEEERHPPAGLVARGLRLHQRSCEVAGVLAAIGAVSAQRIAGASPGTAPVRDPAHVRPRGGAQHDAGGESTPTGWSSTRSASSAACPARTTGRQLPDAAGEQLAYRIEVADDPLLDGQALFIGSWSAARSRARCARRSRTSTAASAAGQHRGRRPSSPNLRQLAPAGLIQEAKGRLTSRTGLCTVVDGARLTGRWGIAGAGRRQP